MNKAGKLTPQLGQAPPVAERSMAYSPALLTSAGALLLFLAYWLIFALTTNDAAGRGAVMALNNAVPAVLLAVLTHLVLERFVWPRPAWIRLAVQVPLALLFALAWYLSILVVRELRGDWATNGFLIKPFVPVAFAWQMFQGITFYALAALASLAISLSRRLRALENTADPQPELQRNASTILIRTADGTEAVPVEQIASISGAGDYSEVALPGRTILSTTTLTDFAERLPKAHFIRAHRSHLVRLGAVREMIPWFSGRYKLVLSGGLEVIASRARSRDLRERLSL